MNTLINLATLSAADDVRAAAAEDAASASRELLRHKEKEDDDRIFKSMRRMLQDIFYDRELDFSEITNLKSFIGRSYDYNWRRIAYEVDFPRPKEPNRDILLSIASLIIFLFTIKGAWYWHISSGFIGLFVYNSYEKIKILRQYNKSYWDDVNNHAIKKYNILTSKWAEKFPILNDKGLLKKADIDNAVKDAYNALVKENSVMARKAKVKLYSLLIEVDNLTEDYLLPIYDEYFTEGQDISYGLFHYETMKLFREKSKIEYDKIYP